RDHDAVNVTRASDVPWRYRHDGQDYECKPSFRLWVNSPASGVAAAVQGVGLTRVLGHMVEDHLRAGTLVRVFEDYHDLTAPVHLVYVRQGLLPLKVRAFLDWMTPRLRKRLAAVD